MKIVRADDTSNAICDSCKMLVEVTFSLRDVPLSDGSDIVKDVLVGVCNRCDGVCVLPHQSVPRVAATIEQRRRPVDSRVPAHMLDILNLASVQVGAGSDFIPSLIKYYLHALAIEEISASGLARYLQTDLAAGKAQKRISLKGRRVSDDIQDIKALTKLDSTSDIIKSVILKINDDILQKKREKPMRVLEGIAAACQ